MRIALLIVVVLVLAPGVDAASAVQTTPMPSLQEALLREINSTRANHGLSQLSLSPALQSAARAHTGAMLADGFFAHESADGTSMSTRLKQHYRAGGYAYWSVAENLLEANYVISAHEAVRLWLQSPGHRRNLLTPNFRQVGIAAARRNTAPGVFRGEPAVVITLDLGTRTAAG